jgi:undecaprenyl-diphosphatase
MINYFLFQKINSFAGQKIWLDHLGVFFSDYAGYILMAVLVLIFIFKSTQSNRFMVLVALISTAVSRGIITTVIRFFYHHPRPFEVLTVRQLIPESGYSFPSGHAAFYFALSAGVYFYNRKLGISFFVVSVLIGIARVFVGVHWPLDILGGVLVGLISAVGVNFLLKKFVLREGADNIRLWKPPKPKS